METTHFTIFLPGLEPALTEVSSSNVSVLLTKFLRKSTHTRINETDSELKFKLITGDVPASCPIALMSAVGDGLSVGPHVMRADPVEFKVGLSHAYMVGYRHLSFSQAELTQLTDLISPLLTEFNLQLIFSKQGRGYLVAPEPLQLDTTEPDVIVGKTVTDYLPGGADKKFWLRLMTEIQMQLSQSEFNQSRVARGLPQVTGLWFWGQGDAKPFQKINEYQSIYSDDEVVLGLANQCGVNTVSAVEPLADIINDAAKVGGNYLLASSVCLRVLNSDELQVFAQTLLNPLLQAINERKITFLRLYPGDKHCYDIKTNVLRKWWQPWSRN